MTTGSSLAILPGIRPGQRIELVLGQRPEGGLVFELREQHFAEGIGWFDQRTLALEPEQVRQLRQALGPGSSASSMLRDELADSPATIPFPGPTLPGQCLRVADHA